MNNKHNSNIINTPLNNNIFETYSIIMHVPDRPSLLSNIHLKQQFLRNSILHIADNITRQRLQHKTNYC